MANLPPQNNFNPNTIPSSQLPPGYDPALHKHIGQPTPPLIGSYGIKQNVNSNSPQLGAPPQTNPVYMNHLGSHSSSNSPAFNRPGMPPTSVPQFNQSLPQRPPVQQPGPQIQPPLTQYGPSVSAPSIRPPTSNTGDIPSSSRSFHQYPQSSGVGNSGLRPMGPSQQQWPQHAPVHTSVSSSQQSQPYPLGPPLQNGPLGNANTAAAVSPLPVNLNRVPPTSNFGGTPITSAPGSQHPINNLSSSTMNGPPTSNFGGLPALQSQIQTGQSIPPSGSVMSSASGLPYGDSRLAQRAQGNQPIVTTSGSPIGSQSGTKLGSPSGPHLGPPTVPQLGPPIGSQLGPPSRPQLGPLSGPQLGPPIRPQLGPPSAPQLGPPSGPQLGPPSAQQIGPPGGSQLGPISGPQLGPASGSQVGPPSGPQLLSPSGQQSGPPRGSQSGFTAPIGPPSGPAYGQPSRAIHGPQNGVPLGPSNGPPMGLQSGPSSMQSGPSMAPPSGYQPGPPSGPPIGPPSGPSNAYPQTSHSSLNSRYPQNVPPQPNYSQSQQNPQGYPQHNGPQQMQGLSNQMGQMSVTQQGFNQMWGQQMYDLLQTRQILPEYPEDPPEIRLGQQFAESVNCSPDIFRCTINRIPETNSLLQKSRLPLGILIHPFKDLNHLPVIQCSAIVRCRSCRTYINPFVYFVDSKRWKCNLCYRVNDLPEEFQYDPVSKSYGDPTRRPEIKSATIEFIAPGEYMLRPPQPAVYLFLLDVSDIACESGYLQVFCDTLKSNLDQLPGDARTQVGFICYDANVHFYLLGEGLTRPREMTVIDIDDVFLPSPEYLLVNLGERREMITDLLDSLPKRHCEQKPRVRASALGAALQAAYKLMAPTGGRVTVMQTCLPSVGPGALTSREDPNARSSKDVAHLNPATDFYKRLALECSGAQVAVDLFVASSQYSDLATLSGISKFSGGSVYYIPVFSAQRAWQAEQLRRMLVRYITRKIGFEAVMRVRCTRGISIHTFHGNFFVRSTDLLSLPNVSPDVGFGMQLTIEESLSDLQQVCFQAALLYTSSKGERRIRVHTLCLPVASNLTDIMHSADQQCIIGLLTKMAVDRAQQSTLSDAREALSNVAVDTLAAHRLAQNLPSGAGGGLQAPACLRLLCLYLSATLKHPAFRAGISTRLDDRVAAMLNMKCMPLSQLLRSIYPDLYPIHNLHEYLPQPSSQTDDEEIFPDPPRLHLSAERINANGAYLLDDGEQMIIYICSAVSPAYLLDTFGVSSYSEISNEARELPALETNGNELLHSFVDKLNEERPYASNILIMRDNSPSRKLFTDRLVDDRIESTFAYYEFLQHIRSLMK